MSAPADEGEARMDERFAERREEVRRERQRRLRRWLGSLALLLALAAATAAIARSPLFGVTDVEVVGATGERAEAVREAAGIEPGDNLLAADVERAASEVTRLPWVAEAEVERQLPATIEVRLAQREPFAVVRLANASWTVDEGGMVLAGGAADGVVRVDAPESIVPPPGERIGDEAVLAALTFHRGLPDEFAPAVRRYEAPSPTGLRMEVEVQGRDPVWVRVGGADQPVLKAEVVAALLEERRSMDPGDGPVEEFDVRAPANPVVIPSEGS